MTWIKLDDRAPRQSYCLEHHDWHTPAFLYVMSLKEHPEFVKIGIAQSPQARLESLRISNPFTLFIVTQREACCMAFARNTEARMHEFFSDKHVSTEWFRLTSEDISKLVADLEAA